MVASPAGLLILSTPLLIALKTLIFDPMGKNVKRWVEAYLADRVARTIAEQKIYQGIEDISARHIEDRQYYGDRFSQLYGRFDALEGQIVNIWRAIEKRRSSQVVHEDAASS
ncbi:hypothetical protein GF380_01145 [Candidatus Uhrbacteria bacterium]|nr:hypothetical protein [Candidatus Uhrbacteria bacterium]